MTTRLKGVYVAFEEDIREDDAESIIQAIRMIRRIAAVSPVEGGDASDWLNRQQVRSEIAEAFGALWEFVITGKPDKLLRFAQQRRKTP